MLCSNPFFSRQGEVLAHLDPLPPHDLMIWTAGSVPFPFGRGGSGVLAYCSLCGTEATLTFSAGPLCSSFSAESCAILQAFSWSGQHQQVCPYSFLFLQFDFRFVLNTLCSSQSFLLHQTLWKIWQELSSLSSCTISLQWVSRHSFLLGNNAADELAGLGVLSLPTAIPCSLYLTSQIHSCLFSDWRRAVSCKFFDPQVPSVSLVLLRLCPLSRLRCNGHGLVLNPYLSKICRIENLSCSACGHPS